MDLIIGQSAPLCVCVCVCVCMRLSLSLSLSLGGGGGFLFLHQSRIKSQLRIHPEALHWMVSVLGPLFRTAGHTVRTQHGVTASAGQRRGDVEIRSYLRDQAGSRSLVFDLSIAHDRFWSSSHVLQNRGLLSGFSWSSDERLVLRIHISQNTERSFERTCLALPHPRR
jgi:hypothetical protein